MSRTYYGVVEDCNDHLKMARVRVRVAGVHTHDKVSLPTKDLPWAPVVQRTNGGAWTPAVGSVCVVEFVDYPTNQYPIVMGILNTVPQDKSVFINETETEPTIKNISAPQGMPIPKNAEEANGGNGATSLVTEADAKNAAQAKKTIESAATALGAMSSGSGSSTGTSSTSQNILAVATTNSSMMLGSSGAYAQISNEGGGRYMNTSDAFARLTVLSGSFDNAFNILAGNVNSKYFAGKIPSKLLNQAHGILSKNLDIAVFNLASKVSLDPAGFINGMNFVIKNTMALLDPQTGLQAQAMRTANSLITTFSVDNLKQMGTRAAKDLLTVGNKAFLESMAGGVADIQFQAAVNVTKQAFTEGWDLAKIAMDSGVPWYEAIPDSLAFKMDVLNVMDTWEKFNFATFFDEIIESIDYAVLKITLAIDKMIAAICEYVIQLVKGLLSRIQSIIAMVKKILKTLKIDRAKIALHSQTAALALAQLGVGYNSADYAKRKYNGNMAVIAKKGASNVTGKDFKDVGEGNTPPTRGVFGGANFRGAKADVVKPKATNTQMFPLGATGDVDTSLPAEVYGFAYKTPTTIKGAGLTGQVVHGCFPAISVEKASKLIYALKDIGMTSDERLMDIIAVMARESGGFTAGSKPESLYYTSVARLDALFPVILKQKGYTTTEQKETLLRNEKALAEVVYGGRFGNTNPGDGYKYRGRGYVQLTFKNNYKLVGQQAFKMGFIKDPNEWVTYPEKVLEGDNPLWSAIAYLVTRNVQTKTNFIDVMKCVGNVIDATYQPALEARNRLQAAYRANSGGITAEDLAEVEKAKSIDNVPEQYKQNALNLKKIAEKMEDYGLKTKEAKCAFLAIVGATCDFIPMQESHKYDSVETLKNRFPKSFAKDDANNSLARSYIFKDGKPSASDFFNHVYDPANDGSNIGNTTAGDGAKFCGGGLILIRGRKEYEKYATMVAQTNEALKKDIEGGCSSLIKNLEASTAVAILTFLEKMADVNPTAHPQYFYTAKDIFLSDDNQKAKAETMYGHFLGATTLKMLGLGTMNADGSIDINSVNGLTQVRFAGDEGTIGFTDPSGKYPIGSQKHQPTTNPTGRGEFGGTVVRLKESQRKLRIPIAMGQGHWNQPHSSYGASYPYNHATFTNSGHLWELDDTPGHERIHLYHRSGTFDEIDVSGTKTSRIVGDGYEIIDKNGFIYINGDCAVTVGGNVNIYCRSDANIQVEGNTELKCGGNLDVGVAGEFNLAAEGDINMWSNGTFNLQSMKNGHIRTEENLYVTAKGDKHNTVIGNLYDTVRGDIEQSVSGKVNRMVSGDIMDKSLGGYDLLVGGGFTISSMGSATIDSVGAMRLASNNNLTTTAGMNLNLLGGIVNTSGSEAVNVVTKGNLLLNSAINTTILSVGALSVLSDAVMCIHAVGVLNLVAGGEMLLGSGAVFGLDATMVNLNSAVALPAFKASTTALTAANTAATAANKYIAGLGVMSNLPSLIMEQVNEKSETPADADLAVIHGMKPPSKGSPIYPRIEACVIEEPVGEDKYLFETDAEQQSQLSQHVVEQSIAQNGVTNSVTSESYTVPPTKVPAGTQGDIDPDLKARIFATNDFSPNFKLSEHVTIGHMCDGYGTRHRLHRQLGLSPQEIVYNMALYANNVLEKIAQFMPNGIAGLGLNPGQGQWWCSSGYRQIGVVAASSKTSDHYTGRACDIQIRGLNKRTHYEIIKKIAESMAYDQLFLEYKGAHSVWIHLGYRFGEVNGKSANRMQCKTYVDHHAVADGFQLRGN